MSMMRFILACPLLGVAWVILEAARLVVGNVNAESHPVKQMLGFLAAGHCLIFALSGKAIAGKQPRGTRRCNWFERFWSL